MMPPQMNETEMKQMENEIAEFQKEIESLSPEEQASFFKSMEEAVQKIDDLAKTDEGKALLDKLDKGSISDEELDQLINQIVGEEEEAEVAPTLVEEPKEEPKPVVKPKQILSSKHEQAIDTINTIIAHSNAFIVKAATVPELPGKIMRWQRHKLVDWQPGLTWNKLKNDIEQFISNLNILLERDQKTKEYYHIDEFLKHEALYNNLKKIKHIVAEYEPQIEEISPLHKSLSKKSKQAFQKMLSQYSEALYTLNVIEELKKLVAKFQPKAKMSREEEEKAFQKAELEKKKKSLPGAPITVGTREPEYAPFSPRRSREASAVRTPPTHPVYFPSAQETPEMRVPSTSKTGAAAGSKGGKGKEHTGGKEKDGDEEKDDEKDTDAKEEKDDKLSALKKQAAKIEKTDKKTFEEADKIVAKIAENIKNVAATLKRTPFFDHPEHLTDESDIDFTFATEVMSELMRDLSMRRGAIGNITELHNKLGTPFARKKYQKTLQDLLEKNKKQIDTVLNQLATIEGKWPTLVNEMPKSKQYAYFAQEQEVETPQEVSQDEIDAALEDIEKKSTSVEEGLEKAVEYLQEQKQQQPIDTKLVEAQQKIPAPVSLFELKKNIATLNDMISHFDQATLTK